MANKPYSEMSDDELRSAMSEWTERVRNAGAWAPAYFAAKQTAAIEAEAQRRGLTLENEFQIKVG